MTLQMKLQEYKELGLEEGTAEGKIIGQNTMLYSLVHDGLLAAEVACQRANPPVSQEQFLRDMHRFYKS